MDTKNTKHFSSEKGSLCPWCPLWLTFLFVVSLLYVAPGSAQQPTFRSGTKLVIQTVSVKDKDGKPVEGLTARDFVVSEDGEPQTVSFVEYSASTTRLQRRHRRRRRPTMRRGRRLRRRNR